MRAIARKLPKWVSIPAMYPFLITPIQSRLGQNSLFGDDFFTNMRNHLQSACLNLHPCAVKKSIPSRVQIHHWLVCPELNEFQVRIICQDQLHLLLPSMLFSPFPPSVWNEKFQRDQALGCGEYLEEVVDLYLVPCCFWGPLEYHSLNTSESITCFWRIQILWLSKKSQALDYRILVYGDYAAAKNHRNDRCAKSLGDVKKRRQQSSFFFWEMNTFLVCISKCCLDYSAAGWEKFVYYFCPNFERHLIKNFREWVHTCWTDWKEWCVERSVGGSACHYYCLFGFLALIS